MCELSSWLYQCSAALVALAVVLILGLRSLWGRHRRLGSAIPGPRGFPCLGNYLSIIQHAGDFMEFVKETCSRHGPVCKLWVGPYLLVCLTDPSDVEVVFKSDETLSKPVIYKVLRPLLGDSLICAEKATWQKFRKMMNPAFSQPIIDGYIETFDQKSRAMADRLARHAHDVEFDVNDYTLLCTLDMVAETALGVTMNIQNEDAPRHGFLDFLILKDKFFDCLFKPWFWFEPLAVFAGNEFRNMRDSIFNVVGKIVDNKCDSNFGRSNPHDVFPEGLRDQDSAQKTKLGFLESLVRITSSNPGFVTKKDITYQCISVMIAATDTSAFVVACTLMLMGLHQDVQRKVLKEQEDIFGEEMDRPVTARDLKEMVYLEQVINEAMRLYPVAPIVARKVDREIRVGGYTLPVGANILIPAFLLHRDPVYYPDPFKFDPDRFSSENSRGRPLGAFAPFAAGRRMCIGKYYAYVAMKTMLSVVLRRYQVLEFGSRDDMECLQFQFLLTMVKGHKIKLAPRNISKPNAV